METYFFPYTETGLALMLQRNKSLTAAKFETRLAETTITRFMVYRLEATPAARPNRKARGCELRTI